MGTLRRYTIAYGSVRNADSIKEGYFVEPYQNTMLLSEMVDWIVSRKTGDRNGPVRYVQSQNGNLRGEFKRLYEDVCELEWANECIGILDLDEMLTHF
jgi:hypothetical protein